MRGMVTKATDTSNHAAISHREWHKAGADSWLRLAAAPTFAIMALVTAALGSGAADMLCSAMHHTSPLGGMVPMYLLMSAFHLPPWLKLVSRQRSVT
jgi:hypothetical protein